MNILITGGLSGVGWELSKALLKNKDHRLFLTYCNSKNNAVKREAEYANLKSIPCDFKDLESVNELCVTIEENDIDVVINNAISDLAVNHFHKSNAEDVLSSFSNNIVPTVSILTEAIKYFKKKKSGKIINMLSSFTVSGPPVGNSIYTAEKKYLESLTNSIAKEYVKFGITCNAVSPSFMLTNLNGFLDDRIVENMRESHPLKDFLNPESVGEIVRFLVEKDMPHLNGINLPINAGE